MSFTISVDLEARQAVAQLRTDRRNLPKVAGAFLTRIAIETKREIEEAMPSDIDRPTPFTRRSLRFKSATSRQLESSVYVLPIQANYLYRLVVPGERVPLRRFIFVPAQSQRSNQYGNMPRARRRRTLGDPELQVRQQGRRLLAFLKRGKRSEYVGVFVPSTLYPRKYWPFHRRAEQAFAKHADAALARAWNKYFREGSVRAR